MSENEQLPTVVVGIVSDTAKLMEAWDALRALFLEYTDSLIESLDRIAAGFGRTSLSAKELEDLLRQVDHDEPTGTPPKKYGMALQKPLPRPTKHYNYIPRTARNLPYQRRTF